MNLEVMWLMKGLVPDHNTIANFRKDNPKAIRKVFHATVSLAKNFDLIGGKLLAGDSTKLRAQNSKKNNFTHRKIEKHIAYIDEKLSEYSAILADSDNDLSQEKKVAIQNKIHKHQHHKINYENFKRELENTGEVQLSTTDPDSRQLITRNNITEVAYKRKHCFRRPSVSAGKQTTVDAKNNIPIDFEVTNKNDSKAMEQWFVAPKLFLGNQILQHFTIKAITQEQSLLMPKNKM